MSPGHDEAPTSRKLSKAQRAQLPPVMPARVGHAALCPTYMFMLFVNRSSGRRHTLLVMLRLTGRELIGCDSPVRVQIDRLE
jgi:hypothetical protein